MTKANQIKPFHSHLDNRINLRGIAHKISLEFVQWHCYLQSLCQFSKENYVFLKEKKVSEDKMIPVESKLILTI